MSDLSEREVLAIAPFDAETPLGIAIVGLSPDRNAPNFSTEALDRIVDSLDGLPDDPESEREAVESLLGLVAALDRRGFREAADALAFALSCSWRTLSYLGFETSGAVLDASGADENDSAERERDRLRALKAFSGERPECRPPSIDAAPPQGAIKLATLLVERRPERTPKPRSASTRASDDPANGAPRFKRP
ncbi:MAG: hypothetical protein H6729_15075 [Deltaproteobacteria bacterium]|nr:hypothetical protein [Deltaproteobacteria bacterium]